MNKLKVIILGTLFVAVFLSNSNQIKAQNIYAVCGTTISIINPDTLLVSDTVIVPNGSPYKYVTSSYVSPDSRHVYLTTSQESGVVIFDTFTNSFKQWFRVPGNRRLHKALVTPDNKELFVIDQDGLMFVIDVLTGNITHTFSTPKQTFDAAMTKDGSKLIVPYRNANYGLGIRVMDTNTKSIIASKGTSNGYHDVVIDDERSLAFITNEYFSNITFFDLNTFHINTIVSANGKNPISIALSDDKILFVSNRDSNHILGYDTVNMRKTARLQIVPPAIGPMSLLIYNDRLFVRVYVNNIANYVQVFDINTLQHLKSIELPAEMSADSGAFFVGQKATFITVPCDIKPNDCENTFNIKSKGVVNLAIFGSADFDITTIDPASVRLNDAPPTKSNITDISAPSISVVEDECYCEELGPDSYPDLLFKFPTQAIVNTLDIENIPDGTTIQLTLTGNLLKEFDELPIIGKACITILKKGNSNKN